MNEDSVLTSRRKASDVNMKEESLIAQKVIYDAMNSADTDARSFSITIEMRQSCKKARERQKLAQASKKGDLQKSEKKKKSKLKEDVKWKDKNSM